MIVDLPSTTTTDVSKRLVALRHAVGAMAMGRVLTLLLVTDEEMADSALEVANDATRQHPARILAVVRANRRGASRLDAQIRVGGDAGASEIVVLRLYGEMADHGAAVVTPLLLPDSPIVAWWPGEPPADVAASPLGAIARRRITDAACSARPATQLKRRARHYAPGDTDLTWTRITRWRGLLAAALDENPQQQVCSATVTAEPGDPSADLIAGWLAAALPVPVHRVNSEPNSGLVSVRMDRSDGPIDLVRATEGLSTLAQPDSPVREVALGTPDAAECLAAELRRLDADEVYAAALTEGLPRLTRRGRSSTQAERGADRTAPGRGRSPRRGQAPSMSSRTLQERSPQESAPSDEALRHRVEAELEQVRAGEVRRAADPDALAALVAEAVATVVQDAVALRGIAHLALTGGSMGARTVAALCSRTLPEGTWSSVHLWWGDERFVPAGHADRNVQQARDAGLDRLPVPAGNIHPAPAGSSPEDLGQAAAMWASELAAHGLQGEHVPRFDVVLLGVGPDAHVASLFPDRPELRVTDQMVVPVSDSPKPPPLRLSLTVPAISAAEHVWFVVAGADKAQAVAAARAAHQDPHLPASWVRGSRETTWWLDHAAAGDG